METKTIKVHKSKNERLDKETDEVSYFDNAILLRYCDNKFFVEHIDCLTDIYQDDYQICHDIIADIFYKQLNSQNYAYTSSSSVAGHHNMNTNGTLIFSKGLPYYVWDNEPEEENGNDIDQVEEY